MIFYHPQLMQDDQQLRLYIVSNPSPFTRFEDHEAALQIQVHEMVQRAIEQGEDPVAMIEDYLGVVYNEGFAVSDIGNYITGTDHMRHAMHVLRDNWQAMTESSPEDSLRYGGPGRQQAVEQYSEMNLRTYLDALSNVFNG